MPQYRSRTSTAGRNMAGARALWRATGMKDGDFEKPIIAIANSFTQFVPGHVHLKDLGQLVAREIEAAGGVAKEFNTIAVDDGIAMGHGGMLYSLPSRELIADSVEYMVNAHCADALVCISNCDKITPGMLMAALRLNIPAIFVSGGPMEAGKTRLAAHKLDLVDAMVSAADDRIDEGKANEIFDLMAKFAAYGFNKAHSAAYGWISYQTAYLKAHYRPEYMAALMTIEAANTDKVLLYVTDCRKAGIRILPVCVNHSMRHFSVPKPADRPVEDGAVDFRHRLRQRVDLDAFVGRLLGRQSHVRKLR